jgi:hypothetical protein
MRPHRNCSWSISAAPGMVIVLSFSAFSTQPGRDIVSVMDGSAGGRVLARLSGTALPSPIYASDATVRITFTADAFIQLGGVRAIVRAVAAFIEGQCNSSPSPAVVTVSNTTSVLVQTNPPTINTTYTRAARCTWVFQAANKDTQALCLNITSFFLSDSDAFAVYQGNPGGADTLLANLSGVSAPSRICSYTAYLRILFTAGPYRQRVRVRVVGWNKWGEITSFVFFPFFLSLVNGMEKGGRGEERERERERVTETETETDRERDREREGE